MDKLLETKRTRLDDSSWFWLPGTASYIIIKSRVGFCIYLYLECAWHVFSSHASNKSEGRLTGVSKQILGHNYKIIKEKCKWISWYASRCSNIRTSIWWIESARHYVIFREENKILLKIRFTTSILIYCIFNESTYICVV